MYGDAIDRAMQGAASTPLTPDQRRKLAMTGRNAWDKMVKAGQTTETFDAWRRRHALMAVERTGLRACTQEDYAPLMAHFVLMLSVAERELGQEVAARRDMAASTGLRRRAAVEPRRVALAKLEAEEKAAADVIERPAAYVASIARARFKAASIADLTERQIWMLVFDLRRNASRRRQKARGGAR